MRKLNQKGMTLIEVLVGSAILAISMALLTMGMKSIGNVWNGNLRFIEGSEKSFNTIQGIGASRQLGKAKINFTLGSTNYTINCYGGITFAQGEDGGAFYRYDANLSSIPEQMIEICKEYFAKTLKELRELGYEETYLNNTAFRNFIRKHEYGGIWPTIDISNYPTEYGIKTAGMTELYVQPYLDLASEDGINLNTPGEEMVVYATNTPTSYSAMMIYHLEEHQWYWKPGSGGADPQTISGYSITNKTWSEVKAQLLDTKIFIPVGEHRK